MNDHEVRTLFEGWVERHVVHGEELDPAVLCADRPEELKALQSLIFRYRKLSDSLDGAPVTASRTAITASRPALLPVLEGFRTIERIGVGGMGEVYKLQDLKLGRFVAAKVLRADRGGTPNLAEFLSEAQTLALFQDRRIVQIHELRDQAMPPVLIMEYIDGFELGRLAPSLEYHQRARIVKEVCEAVHHAHQLGVQHRDLKPSNIMLDAQLQPKILDFGLSSRDPARGHFRGTPQYLAPEQLDPSQPIDARTDVYALGAVLYELLTGVPPVDGPTVDAIVTNVRAGAVRLPVEISVGTPEPLQAITLKALETRPTDRYASAQDMALDLGLYLSGRPVTARPSRYTTKTLLDGVKETSAPRTGVVGTQAIEVPVELEGLSNFFLVLLICIVGLGYLSAWWLGGGVLGIFFGVVTFALASATLFMAILLASRMIRLRRAGFERSRIVHAAFGQPHAWFGWYPSSLRTPGDVWERLPSELKRSRGMLGWTLLMLILVLIPNAITSLGFHSNPPWDLPYPRWLRNAVSDLVFTLFLLPAAASFFFLTRWERSVRGKLADPNLRGYVLITWTGRLSFWRRPEVASLLLPESLETLTGSSARPTIASGLKETSAARTGVVPKPGWSGAVTRWRAWAAAGLFLAAAVGVGSWLARNRGPTESAPSPRLSTGGPASSNAEANRHFIIAMERLKLSYDIPRAREALDRALAADPRFAEARAWKAFTTFLTFDAGFAHDSALLNDAEEEMRRALRDEPTLARAHLGIAALDLMQGRRDMMPAELDQALKGNPNDEDALFLLMQYHHYAGEYVPALDLAARILDRSPLFWPARINIAHILQQRGDITGARHELGKIVEQDPQSAAAHGFLARTYVGSGDLKEARRSLDRVAPEQRQMGYLRLVSATLLAREGHREQARRAMDQELLNWGTLVAYSQADFAAFYAVLGDEATALDWLDRAVRGGDERAEWFRGDPLLANIRDHPRFKQIMETIAYGRQRRKAVP